MAKGIKLNVDAQKIVCATIDLIEEGGFEHLSMRKIALAFNIQAASLYWYVQSRDTLLDWAADEIYERIADLVRQRVNSTNSDALQRSIVAIRGYLLGHSGNAELLVSRTVGGPGYRALLEHLIEALQARGLPEERSVNSALALLAYTLGSVLAQTAPLATSLPTSKDFHQELAEQTDAPFVSANAARIASPDHSPRFIAGLTAMLIGLEA